MIPIASSPLFNGLDPAALTDIMDRLRRRHYQPDEHLCRLGVPGDSLFIIESGLVETEAPPPAQRKSSRMMDPVIETLIMLQMAESIRHAAEVVITPRFGPMNWRDFHLADLAREAAEEQLPHLLNQVKPS